MFTVVSVREGQVNAWELSSAWEAFRSYRDAVIGMEQYAETLKGQAAVKPTRRSEQYAATNFVGLYAPGWVELAMTKCEPWERH